MLSLIISRALVEIGSSLRSVSESKWLTSFSSAAIAGYIFAVSRSFSALSPFIAPFVSRKIGTSNAARLSILLYGLFLFALSFITNPSIYFLVRICLSTVSALYIPLFFSIAQEILRKGKVGSNWGIFLTISFVTGSLGALIPVFFPVQNPALFMRLGAIFYASSAFFIPAVEIAVPKEKIRTAFSRFLSPHLLSYVFYYVAFVAFFSVMDLIFPLYLGIAKYGVLLAISKISSIFMFPTGKIVDRFGYRKVFAFSVFALFVSSFLSAFFPRLLFYLSILYFISCSFAKPAGETFLTLALESKERVQVNSTLRLFRAASTLIITALSGFLYSQGSFLFFLLFSFFYLLSILLLLLNENLKNSSTA